MFLNRARELELLNRWWQGELPELITVYGRRQVGKTELLIRFLADKPTIYFYADRQLVQDHLRAFTEQVLLLADDPLLHLQPFSTWEAALTYTLRLAETKRIAIVIDEFSYAADADPALPSVIQRLWDSARRASSRAFVVLCTSFTEAVERFFHVDGALYRRRSRELRVEPFTYREAAGFFPSWSRIDQALVWGMVGGTPSYLSALRGENLTTAIVEHVLDKSSILYHEAETLLSREVRGIGPPLLHGILQAIAYGASEPNQIAQRVGRPVTALSGALGFLVNYGLVERRVPYTVPNPERSRHNRYYLADNYLSFWFRFVLPNRSALEQGQTDYVWCAKINPQLDTYMGQRFEELCRQFIRLRPELWAHDIGRLGVWWQASDELEIVGDANGEVVLAAEAKWTNEPVGLDVLHMLRRRAALLPRVAATGQLAIFSKSGFTPQLIAEESPLLILETLDRMYA